MTNNDCVCYNWCLNLGESCTKMSLTVDLNIGDCPVTVWFEWTGKDEDGGPNWDSMSVEAFLPCIAPSEGYHWVRINDLLSDEQWLKIEHAIYDNWKDLERQAKANDY